MSHSRPFTRRDFFHQAGCASLGVATLGSQFSMAADGTAATAAAQDAALADRLSDAAIARRKARMVRAFAADPNFNVKKANPVKQHAMVGGRLALDPNDAVALDYVRRVAGFDDKFAYQGLAANFARFGKDWGPELIEAVRASATGWVGFLGGGTENMVMMRRAAGVIFGEAFPEATFQNGLTGRQLVEECKKFMSRYGHAIYGGSMSEYLSPIYVGVSSQAWVHVAEFAKDDEARLMAEALLDWMYADVAVNSFECSMLPPLNREKGLLNGTYQRAVPTGIGPWISWLLFGGGNVPEGEGPFPEGLDPMHPPVGCHALSTWSPHPIIRNIAAKRVTLPFTLHQARAPFAYVEPTMVNDFEKLDVKSELRPAPAHVREHLRSVYFDHDYAMGAGYFRTAPVDPMTRSNLPFGLWWRSRQEHNFLLVSHPYWFAELPGEDGEPAQGDNDWLGISPFCRMVHHENATVLLYDLPEKDPYVDVEQRGSTKLRVQRSGKIIPSIFVYVPETVHERVETPEVFFFREDDVYVSIRPLTAGAKWASSTHRGFVRIAIPGSLTGVVIEAGDRRECGSFQAFQAKIAEARLDTSRLASEKTVEYQSSRGHRLSVAHVPDTWLPAASVNGKTLDYDSWPISESPFVKSKDHVLDINDGHRGFSIDWQGGLPAYTYYDLKEGRRVATRRRFLREGKLVNEVL